MSETLDKSRSEWVSRVLGIQVGGAAAPSAAAFRSEWKKSFETFRDAIEAVDGQMAALGAACRQSRNPWLLSIAELGLPAVTANHKTPLMAACLDVDRAPDDKLRTAAANVGKAAEAFSRHIETSPLVAACDSNPFGVSVSIRSTLAPALRSLDAALKRAV